jgi:hypothetical protein
MFAIKGRHQASYRDVMRVRTNDRAFLASDSALPSVE